jgi:hypothetical protein
LLPGILNSHAQSRIRYLVWFERLLIVNYLYFESVTLHINSSSVDNIQKVPEVRPERQAIKAQKWERITLKILSLSRLGDENKMAVNRQSIEHRSKFQKRILKRVFFLYCTVDGAFKALENLHAYLPVQTASYASWRQQSPVRLWEPQILRN